MSSATVSPVAHKDKKRDFAVSTDLIRSALMAQEAADRWRNDSESLNTRIASQLQAGLELPPGVEFDPETKRLRRLEPEQSGPQRIGQT